MIAEIVRMLHGQKPGRDADAYDEIAAELRRNIALVCELLASVKGTQAPRLDLARMLFGREGKFVYDETSPFLLFGDHAEQKVIATLTYILLRQALEEQGVPPVGITQHITEHIWQHDVTEHFSVYARVWTTESQLPSGWHISGTTTMDHAGHDALIEWAPGSKENPSAGERAYALPHCTPSPELTEAVSGIRRSIEEFVSATPLNPKTYEPVVSERVRSLVSQLAARYRVAAPRENPFALVRWWLDATDSTEFIWVGSSALQGLPEISNSPMQAEQARHSWSGLWGLGSGWLQQPREAEALAMLAACGQCGFLAVRRGAFQHVMAIRGELATVGKDLATARDTIDRLIEMRTPLQSLAAITGELASRYAPLLLNTRALATAGGMCRQLFGIEEALHDVHLHRLRGADHCSEVAARGREIISGAIRTAEVTSASYDDSVDVLKRILGMLEGLDPETSLYHLKSLTKGSICLSVLDVSAPHTMRLLRGQGEASLSWICELVRCASGKYDWCRSVAVSGDWTAQANQTSAAIRISFDRLDDLDAVREYVAAYLANSSPRDHDISVVLARLIRGAVRAQDVSTLDVARALMRAPESFVLSDSDLTLKIGKFKMVGSVAGRGA